MKTLHIYTEEPSMKNVLEEIMPQIIQQNTEYRIYAHQGKQDLEKAIRKTVPKISSQEGSLILVARDKDSGDCKAIKSELVEILNQNCHSPYLVRIVCTELECWFLGDLNAISKVYKRFKPENYRNTKEFRNVDSIQNAPTKLLEIIPEFSKKKSLPKLEFSESVAPYLNINENKSVSFQHFISGVKKLIEL